MDRPPISVLLPTTAWTVACHDVAEQLQDSDELLIICDHGDDPVAEREDYPAGVSVIPAGEPAGCSGKANAIDTGMEQARNDRIVWTDDDFEHPPDWLGRLSADYDTHGPVSEVPFFRGRDPLAILLEPTNAFGGTLMTWLGDVAWGGGVIFECDSLKPNGVRLQPFSPPGEQALPSPHSLRSRGPCFSRSGLRAWARNRMPWRRSRHAVPAAPGGREDTRR